MALDFFAGCIGGCAGVAVGYPLDTVKVRLQTQDARNPTYRGTFHCLQSIVQQESVRGLFKGMSSPIASVAIINSMIFGVYGNVQRRLSEPDSLRSHALAGSVAGLAQSFVCSPMELVKTRIQIQEQVCTSGIQLYKGPVDCARQIWHAEGIRGIFRGLNITIAREIPAFGIYFSSYELMTRREDATKPIGTFHMMMAGGWAGVFSWLFTYPIDFLKSRLQVDGLGGHQAYSGIADCIKKTYRNEGIQGFFRGMSSTLIRSFPVNAVTFSVVTWILRHFEQVEGSSVTYQEASSLQMQEPLASVAPFAHEHHVFNRAHQHFDWLSEWKPLAPALVLAGSGPFGTIAIPNYALQCHYNHWFSGAMSSLVHWRGSQGHSVGVDSGNHSLLITDAGSTGSTSSLLFDCRCQEAEGTDQSPVQATPDESTTTAGPMAVCVSCRKSTMSVSRCEAVRCAIHQAAGLGVNL